MQDSIQGCERTRTPQLSRYLHRCPSGCRREPAGNALKRGARSLMNNQTRLGAQAHARIEHMDGGGVFKIKPIQRRCGTHARDRWYPQKQIESFQTAEKARFG